MITEAEVHSPVNHNLGPHRPRTSCLGVLSSHQTPRRLPGGKPWVWQGSLLTYDRGIKEDRPLSVARKLLSERQVLREARGQRLLWGGPLPSLERLQEFSPAALLILSSGDKSSNHRTDTQQSLYSLKASLLSRDATLCGPFPSPL